MKLAGDVVYAFVVPEYTLGYSLTDFSDETFHIQIFENTAHNGMREQVRGC